MATILDGKALAAKCKERVKQEVASLKRTPGLAVIIVGDNPASRVYVNSKRKDCEECGFFSEEYALPESTTQAELIALIEKLNAREEIDGILCQLPLPEAIDEEAVLIFYPAPPMASWRSWRSTASTPRGSTAWSSAAPTSWANLWPCCCCKSTAQ